MNFDSIAATLTTSQVERHMHVTDEVNEEFERFLSEWVRTCRTCGRIVLEDVGYVSNTSKHVGSGTSGPTTIARERACLRSCMTISKVHIIVGSTHTEVILRSNIVKSG
jgi:hypothetical protein